MPGADLREGAHVFAYGVSKVMLQVLRQCEGDFSQEMIMKQAANLHGVENPVLLPGITVSTSPTNYHPVQDLQLERWDGSTWVRFGGVIDGTDPSP
jgi:branched-chain amino acid transport system substrate-binding protein